MASLITTIEPGTAAIGCSIKMLPEELLIPAAHRAVTINPSNSPATHMAAARGVVIEPVHLSLLTQKRWSANGVRLTVGFMDNPDAGLRQRILSHMNAWGVFANVQFVETVTSPQVRIARTAGSGYWSYLGTDVLLIPGKSADHEPRQLYDEHP